MVAANYVLVLEKVCRQSDANEMLGLVFENEVITRELRNVLFQWSTPNDKFWNEFKVPAPLMINFLKLYTETHPGKNLDPRKVAIMFRNAIGEVLNYTLP
jgi:hypothetical protein